MFEFWYIEPVLLAMTWFFSQNMTTELTNWASHSLFLRGKSESFGSVPKGTTGPTIWKVPKFGRFWRGWGVGRGIGDFRHISGEKIYLARKYLEKKYPALKKELCISARVMVAGIKSHTVVCPEVWEEKKSYTNQITHTPPQKWNWFEKLGVRKSKVI